MADEKLIFPIGFDLDSGVKNASKEWKSTYQKQLQRALDETPLKATIELDTKGLDLKKLKQFNQISKEMVAAAKANAQVRKQEAMANAQVRKQEAMANAQVRKQEAKANAQVRKQEAMANAQVRKQEAMASERERIAEEKVAAAKAKRLTAEERLNQAKIRSTKLTESQNNSYALQSTYLSRLVQRLVAYASIAQAFSFIRNIRDVTMQFELQRVALGSIIGDLNEANAMFEQIKAAAVKSPFKIKELVAYTKQLAAYKIESDELFETTQRLADVSAGLGVGMERLVLAYGQIRATGYLRASEVRQLTEAGIPIVEELAKKMSQLRGETVSAAEVMGLISDRAISFGVVKEVFDDMTSAGGMFYKMQEKQAETLAGQWSNLQDSFSIMYEEMGNTESMNNAMKETIGLIKSLAENWRTVGTVALWSVGTFFGFEKVIKPISNLLKATVLLNKAQEATRKASRLSSLGFEAEANRQLALARAYNRSANSLRSFGGALKSIGAFIKGNIWTILLTALAAIISYFVSARQEANRLNKELAKIGTEGALQSEQSVRNFERLARAIRDSADGSTKQTKALEEMKRAYGEFLPSQDKSIINLVREKDGYNAVTQAIREKIALQIQEQKLNTIASEYGKRIGEIEGDIVNSATLRGNSKEEISLFISAIKQAVDEGTISLAEGLETTISKARKIFSDFDLGYINDATFSKVFFEGGLLYKGALLELIKAQEEYNKSVQDVENSMESATGSLGKYATSYKTFKESLKNIQGKGEKFSFEWSESKTKSEITAYKKFVGELLSKEGIKFNIGESIDFKALYKAIGGENLHLKNIIAKIQGEYESLIPTDITRLANDKLKEYAKTVGISMDDVKSHLKNNEQSTEDWAKSLKSSYESLEKKLAEFKLLQSESTKDSEDYSKDIEKIESEMKVLTLLMAFFKDFFKAKIGGGKKTNPRIAMLNEELSTVEKIYKEYQDLRKVMSEDEARTKVGNMFESVNLKMLDKALSPEDMRKQLQVALDKAKKLGDKKQILEFEYKLGKFDSDEAQREIENQLKKISEDISRTNAAKDFYDKMMGMTGDKDLSTSLTLSVYGGTDNGDIGESLAKDMADKFRQQVQTYFGDIDISSAIDKATGKIDPIKLEKLIDVNKMGEDNVIEIQKIINDLIKTNADFIAESFKSYDKFFDFEKRKTMVTQREEEARKKIRESNIPEDEKKRLLGASEKAEKEQISSIEIEELKSTADWENTFEDLNNLGRLTVKNLIGLLDNYIKKKKEAGEPIDETDLKTLKSELNKLYERDAQLDPFTTVKTSLKDLITATKDYNKARKAGDKEGMADAENRKARAFNNLEKSLNSVASEYQSVSDAITQFQELLGVSKDSAFGEVLGGIANGFSKVSQIITTLITLTLLFNAALWANPLFAAVGIAAGVLGAIAGVFSAISNAKVRKANKEIEKQQQIIDKLEYSYGRLEKAKEKALGSDYVSNYEERLRDLQAQEVAYRKQAEAERSKGKNEDEEKTKEYEKSARDTADEIKDMQDELQNYFLGTDITSAARDFAQSWIDAYAGFENTTNAIKERFKDMIQNMIIESLAARVMENALSGVYDSIEQYSPSGISVEEAAEIAKLTEIAAEDANTGMTNLMNALEAAGLNIRGASTDLTGISKDIASASEESILGLAAGINTQNFYISQIHANVALITQCVQSGGMESNGVSISDLVNMQNQHLSYLPNIASNTAETLAECRSILSETRRVADNLDRVIKPRDVKSSYTLNTSL